MAPPSLATARRQQDGMRRVSFSETRMTSSRLYDSDDSIDERLREEEEEERALSERHGEAEDDEAATADPSQSRKRKTTESEKDIAQELDQEEKKKIKKPRPQLLPANLTNENGLIKLPIEMKRIKYKPRKGKKRDVPAAASYCQNLVSAYQAFCDDLFPSMNFEDVLLKIEQLGSKKEVKTFLEQMRNNTRNEHLEKLYGREKAERMLQELDDGLKQQQLPHDEEDEYGDYYSEPVQKQDSSAAAVTPGRESAPINTVTPNISTGTKESETTHQVSPPMSTPATRSRRTIESDDEEQEEVEANFDEEMAAAEEAEANFDEEMEAAAAAAETTEQQVMETSTKPGPSTAKETEPDEQLSDEEVEATFDEDVALPSNENQAVPTNKTHEESSESQLQVEDEDDGQEVALDSSTKTTDDLSTSEGNKVEIGGDEATAVEELAAAKDSTIEHMDVATEAREKSMDQLTTNDTDDEKESAVTEDKNPPSDE